MRGLRLHYLWAKVMLHFPSSYGSGGGVGLRPAIYSGQSSSQCQYRPFPGPRSGIESTCLRDGSLTQQSLCTERQSMFTHDVLQSGGLPGSVDRALQSSSGVISRMRWPTS